MKYFSEKALEKKIEAIGGGGKTYSAGAGLDLNDTVFSIEDSVLAEIAKISDWFELKDGNIHVLKNRGFWSDSFISAGGLSSGGGAAAGNATLSNVTTTGATISADGVGSIDVYSKGYLDTALAQAGKVQSVVGQTGAVTAAQIGSALISEGYELTDHTYTNGTGLSLAGGEFSVSTEYQAKIQSGEDAYTDLHNWFERINIGTEPNPVWVIHVKSDMGFYSDSFVSAGGISPGGGASAGNATLVAQTYGGTLSATGIDPINFYSKEKVDQLLAIAGTVQTVAGVSPTSGDIPVASLKSALGLGAAAAYGIGSVASGNTGLVTGGSVYSAINEAVSSVMKMQGTTTTPISDGSTTNPVVIDGSSYTAKKGDVVLYDGKEYLWAGSAWEQLGDEASWALKTTSISAGTGLAGGGTLASNRTISINPTYQTYISNGNTAYGWGNHANAGYLLATTAETTYLPLTGGTISSGAIIPLIIDSGTTISGIAFSSGGNIFSRLVSYTSDGTFRRTDALWSNEYVIYDSGNSNLSTVDWAANQMTANSFKLASGTPTLSWDADANAWHLSGNFYADGFISAGGISPGGGSGGIDPTAMWQLLGAPTNEQIAVSHLTTALNGYATQTWVTGCGYITGINSSMITTALGYTPVAPSALNDYLPLAGGTMTGALNIGSSTSQTEWLPINFRRNGYLGFVGSAGNIMQMGVGNKYINVGESFSYTDGNVAYTVYHAGNANRSGVSWYCNDLIVSGNIYIPNNNAIQFTDTNDVNLITIWLTINNQLDIGRFGAQAGYDTAIYGNNIYFYYGTSNTAGLTITSSGEITTPCQIQSSYSSGAPFTVSSTERVINLNADLLDGQEGTYYATSSSVSTLQGYFTNGVANYANQLYNSRYLWGNSFNGTQDLNGSIGVSQANDPSIRFTQTADNKTAAVGIDGAGFYIYGDGTTVGSIIRSNLATGEITNYYTTTFNSSIYVVGVPYFYNNHPWCITDAGGTFRYQIWYTATNNFFVGRGGAEAGHDTYLCGNNVHITYGTSAWQDAITINSSGLVGVRATPTSGATMRVGGTLFTDDALSVYSSPSDRHRVCIDADPNAGYVHFYDDTTSTFGDLRLNYAGGKVSVGYSSTQSATFAVNGSISCATSIDAGGEISTSSNITISNSEWHTLNIIRSGTGSGSIGVDGEGFFFGVTLGNNYTHMYLRPSNLYVATNIDSSGTIHSSTGIWSEGYVSAGGLTSSSDERLKSGIKDFGYSAEMLMALRPREWDWNEKSYMKGHAAGVVAQELQQVMPYAIVERQYLSVNYDMLHGLEIAGLQDHETRIRQLERENAELKRRLNMN